MHYFEKVFHVLVLTSFIGLFANIAQANSFTTTGKLIIIEHIVQTISKRQPQQVCRNVEVPIYGTVQNNNGGASGGDVLAGAIIGGILGKAITGKDNGAAFGALAGAMTSAEKKKNGTSQQIVGYKTENRCETHYHNVQSQIVNEYRLIYLVDGHEFAYVVNSAVGQRAYIGQTKKFRIRYQMLN